MNTRVQCDILSERDRQDAQWGGPDHDDTHSSDDWNVFIRKQLVLAHTAHGKAEYRMRMVRIAALAVAAIESFDRKQEPPSESERIVHEHA